MASEDSENKKPFIPPCDGLQDLFFGDKLDLREEAGREEREAIAEYICQSQCEARFSCLAYALINNEEHGVWGGMSPGKRREFKRFLRKDGYADAAQTKEFVALVNLWEGDDDGSGLVDDRNGHRRLERRYEVPTAL